jgi:ribulose-phosphate 3-epimerase
LQTINRLGMQAGVSIKPATPLSAIEEVLPLVDLVLIMTVEPGFGGQQLISPCLNKIRTLNRQRDKQKLRFKIQADGGINEETASIVAAAGADVLVAGSAVFNQNPVKDNIATLLKSLQG